MLLSLSSKTQPSQELWRKQFLAKLRLADQERMIAASSRKLPVALRIARLNEKIKAAERIVAGDGSPPSRQFSDTDTIGLRGIFNEHRENSNV